MLQMYDSWLATLSDLVTETKPMVDKDSRAAWTSDEDASCAISPVVSPPNSSLKLPPITFPSCTVLNDIGTSDMYAVISGTFPMLAGNVTLQV